MRKTNKKGFTIVELVIVIAVIAILAAVLIPTIVGLVKKANLSADSQAVRQMNMALASVEAPKNLDGAIDILSAAGYNAKDTLVPVTKDHSFYWYMTHNIVVLVNDNDNTLVYPDDDKYSATFAADIAKTGDAKVLFNLEGGAIYIDVAAKDAATLENALELGSTDIKLDADVKLETQVKIPAGAKVTLDLNGKTITTTQITGRSKYLDVAGELTVTNGTIEARGIEVLNGGKLVIAENADIVVSSVDENGGAAVWVEAGGTVEINGGTFKIKGVPMSELVGATVVYNNGGNVTINGGKFESLAGVGPYAIQSQNGGTVTINGGEFSSDRGCLAAGAGGKFIVNGGKFTSNWSGDNAYVFAAASGDCEITLNGTITIEAPSITHEVWIETGSVFTNNSNLTFTANGEYFDLVTE